MIGVRILRGVTGLARAARFAFRDRRGGAAVEFAILSPVLCVLLAAAADFGGVVYVKFRMENALSAGANYALVNAVQVTSKEGSNLAAQLAAFMANSDAVDVNSVLVNNGPSAEYKTGKVTTAGTAANADSCYCPTVAGGAVTWGAAAACGSECAAGGSAGKFVTISATRDYTPFLSNYGIVEAGSISVSAMVQTQ